MRYIPRHALPIDEEWDGSDPLTAIEENLDRKLFRQDARRSSRIATNRENRKHLRDSKPEMRRLHMALKPIVGHKSSGCGASRCLGCPQ